MEERKEQNSTDHDRKRPKVSHQSAKRELDATNAKQQVWLVKVPTFVASSWARAQNNEVLGQMMVGIKPNEGTKQMIIKLDESRNQGSNSSIPTQFTLEEMKTSGLADGNSMLAFNIDEDTKQFAIEGAVTKSLVLKPSNTAEYHNLMKERSRQNASNRREVGLVDNEELEKAARQSYTIEFLSSVKGELKKKGAAGKGATGELDSKALKSKMFEAFESEERLGFDSLLSIMSSQVTGFSREAELRTELEKYAVYNHKGPHRGLWELKTQFKTNVSSSSTSASNAAPPSSSSSS
ncbi:hypothetical protein EON65_16760 [archaeon]|nr:MAG: hypothetical protein EON65_16760 [archaeon]